MNKRVWLVLVLVVSLLCVVGCNDNDDDVVEPDHLERVEPTLTPTLISVVRPTPTVINLVRPTPTPINVGTDGA